MKYYTLLTAALLLSLSISSCKDDIENPIKRTDPNNPEKPDPNNILPEEADAVTLLANDFVFQIMDYYYLYNEGITKDGIPVINYLYEKDTKEYFYKLLDEKDIFSFISDDAESFHQEQSGVSTAMGWDYTLMYADETRKNVVAAINFVYPNTPAANAGAKRGDFIYSIDGTDLTPENYQRLWNKQGVYKGTRHPEQDVVERISYTLVPDVINVSPVAANNIFTLEDGTKVGYLLYMDFYAKFNNELTEVFMKFKEAGVSRLILDLRYNTGGEMLACSHLASLIAPASVVEAEKEIVHYKFNANLSKQNSGTNNGARFTKEALPANLDLKDIVIIQGHSSYSASEATIIGLKPYMNVYTIGQTSGGKNTTMYVISPDLFTDSKTEEPLFDVRIHNWLIAPLVAVYYNSKNETFDTTDGDGMDPDYDYNEFRLVRRELGDEKEDLTALALSYIATGAVSESKSSSIADFTNMLDVAAYKKPKAVQIPFKLK